MYMFYPCLPFFKKLVACLMLGLVLGACASSRNAGFELVNPYQKVKRYPYKASFHNHTAYHPEYMHAKTPPVALLTSYRDYDTAPLYGIVGISDHERVTTPWNVVPSGRAASDSLAWAVDSVLWIPCNETNIGNNKQGGVFGDLLAINVPVDQIPEIDWAKNRTERARSGWVYRSAEMPARIALSFVGTGVEWFAAKEPEGGIVGVFVDGQKVGDVDLHASDQRFGVRVFSLAGLQSGKHLLELVYDRKGKSSQKYMGSMNMDMVVVSQADGATVTFGADHPALTYHPLKYRQAQHPKGEGRGVGDAFRALAEDMGCFLVLAHPNARLETEGEYAGTQRWTSAGYTHAELDTIFGDTPKKADSLNYLPHALEIGNRGYDFSPRSGYRNAEEKWDYLLRKGHRIMGFASDDTHGEVSPEGWVVIHTEAPSRGQLAKDDVMESLRSGNYYSSQGPNMTILVEGNALTVRTDANALIEIISKDGIVFQRDNATEATYRITGHEQYVRAKVTRADDEWRDVKGGIGRFRSAWTNPIYVLSK